MRIVLASASPRRKELLEQIGLKFEVLVSEADESVDAGWTPWQVVEALSLKKAEAVRSAAGVDACIIGADTVVALDGRILGKPRSEAQAVEMLEFLQGREHYVYTGVSILMPDGRKKTFHEATKVCFAPMSKSEILEYVAGKDPMDKAGAYGIQGFCARYIKGIEGDYNNVVGLPIGRLYQELSRMERAGKQKLAAVFDLDGTLSDSIGSIKYSADLCLQEVGCGPFSEKEYMYFAGDGAANLIKRALAAAGEAYVDKFPQVFTRYREVFAQHCMDGVKPYDGICQLLTELKKKGMKLAVLSNKPHQETIRVIETLFGKDMFDVIQGQTEDMPIKPSPAGVFRILRILSERGFGEILPENLIYIGDTGTDMKTGRGAGAYTFGALWGFREQEELEQNGADVLVNHPLDILKNL